MVSKQVFNFIINEFDYKLHKANKCFYYSEDKRLKNKSIDIMNDVILYIRKIYNESTLLDCLKQIRPNFIIDPNFTLMDYNDHFLLDILFKDSSDITEKNDLSISEIIINRFLNFPNINIDKTLFVQNLNKHLNRINYNYNNNTITSK